MAGTLLKGLIEKLKPRCESKPPFDPARFNDPLAPRIEWTPISKEASNFCTHRLKIVSPGQAEFRPTLGVKLFSGVFVLLGLAGIIAALSCWFTMKDACPDTSMFGRLFLPGIALFFLAIGGGMFFAGTTPIGFDTLRGYFWRGRKAPHEAANWASMKNCARLYDVHALQLLSKYVAGNKGGGYYCYELNLALKDGRRLNVVSHGHQGKLREDAAKLSGLLGKPVWDAALR